jgi:glucuronate isomerase
VRAVPICAGQSAAWRFIEPHRIEGGAPPPVADRALSRRLDSVVLDARLVAEHRLEEDGALEAAVDLIAGRPTEVFKL